MFSSCFISEEDESQKNLLLINQIKNQFTIGKDYTFQVGEY